MSDHLPEVRRTGAVSALPGVARLAATSWLRTAQWSVVAGVRTGRRVAGVVTNPRAAVDVASGVAAASGIVANIYRLLAPKPESGVKKTAYYIVMVVAGPSVLFDNAARSWRQKGCSAMAFWLAAALSAYWSFIIGLFGLSIIVAV